MVPGIFSPNPSHIGAIGIAYGQAIHVGNIRIRIVINVVATLVGFGHAVVVTKVVTCCIVAVHTAYVMAQLMTKSIGAFNFIDVVIPVHITPAGSLINKGVVR